MRVDLIWKCNKSSTGAMPLSHSKFLNQLDLDTQAMVSDAYLESCSDLDDPNRSLAQLDELRKLLGDEMIKLAVAGERDPEMIKSIAVATVKAHLSSVQ